MEKLKNCQCGSEQVYVMQGKSSISVADVLNRGNDFVPFERYLFVKCANCGCEIKGFVTVEEAIAAWNRRAAKMSVEEWAGMGDPLYVFPNAEQANDFSNRLRPAEQDRWNRVRVRAHLADEIDSYTKTAISNIIVVDGLIVDAKLVREWREKIIALEAENAREKKVNENLHGVIERVRAFKNSLEASLISSGNLTRSLAEKIEKLEAENADLLKKNNTLETLTKTLVRKASEFAGECANKDAEIAALKAKNAEMMSLVARYCNAA